MPTTLLMLTPQTPFPPDQGAPIRNFNFIKHLGSSGQYELTLLTFDRGQNSENLTTARHELERYCKRIEFVPFPGARSKVARLQSLLVNRQPDLTERLTSTAFADTFNQLLAEEKPDVILCEGLELAPFVFDRLERVPKNERPKLVLDEHNAEWMLQRRAFEVTRQEGLKRGPVAAYNFVQARRLKDYEQKALNFFDCIIAVSEADKQHLGPQVAVIPNGIDTHEYQPDEGAEVNSKQLVFTGSMDFRPNVDAVVWFAREVWPLIQHQIDGVKFVIVGRRPTAAVQALAQIPGIEVTGEVPDARPYIQSSALYVVPMRMGGGVRFKVLEALAMGKPVLTTSMGADGIALTPGQHAVVADTPTDFAVSALQLLHSPARRNELAQAGRAFVVQNYDWDKITPKLDSVLLS